MIDITARGTHLLSPLHPPRLGRRLVPPDPSKHCRGHEAWLFEANLK